MLTITNGMADDGGGIAVTSSITNVTVNQCTIADNAAPSGGGGIEFGGALLNVINSTFSNNTVPFLVLVAGFRTWETWWFTYSTFSGNFASFAAELYIIWAQPAPSPNTTIFGVKTTGADINDPSGSLKITNSVLAATCYFNISNANSGGYNITTNSTCGFSSTGDQTVTPAVLNLASSLTDNGGPTPTLALLTGSPAIDHVPVSGCPDIDQRGFHRPDDGEPTCDSWAYESGAVPYITVTI